MGLSSFKFALFSLLLSLVCAAYPVCAKPAASTGNLRPDLLLWAWEMPCDMSFIDASRTGIAFFAGRITVKSDKILEQGRFQKLKFPSQAYKTAVIRIDVEKTLLSLSDTQIKQVCDSSVHLFRSTRADSLQIDFDAKLSQRSSYVQLLKCLRRSLPEGTFLSVTALSSWVLGDYWLDKLSCDEIVPMFFSMGAAKKEALDRLRTINVRTGSIPLSFGFSISELDLVSAIPVLSKHVYLFSSGGWNSRKSRLAYEKMLKLLKSSN